MSNNKLYESELLCLTFIEKYKNYLEKYIQTNQESEYYCLRDLLIFFKGSQETSLLLKLTKNQNWYKDNKLVEKIWGIKCNSKERLEFVSPFILGLVIKNALKKIYQFEEQFRQRFGDGKYLSPGLVIDKYICNIWHQDTRTCIHIAGKLYERKICEYKPMALLNKCMIFKESGLRTQDSGLRR